MKPKILIVLMTVTFGSALMGCEQKGPAEEAGAKIDEAVEKAGGKLEEAGEAIEKKASD